jgi:hypothetical protein
MGEEKMKHEPDELYIQWMEDHHKESKQRENYSNARLDLLTISISGAGLYIALETLKFLFEEKSGMPSWPVKVAGVLFTCAIAVNFWSQHTGRRTNIAAAQWALYEALKEKNGHEYPEQDPFEKDRECFGRMTKWLNVAATLLMLGGVASLVTVYLIFL